MILRTERLSKTFEVGVRRKRVQAVKDLDLAVAGGGDLRLRRAERRRQDHHHQDADGAHLPHLAARPAIFDAPIPSTEAKRAHRLPARRTPPTTTSSPAGRPLRFFATLSGVPRRRARTPRARSCSSWSGSPTPPTGRSASTRRACSSGSASPRRWSGDPSFVVLDEPMSGLDPIGRKEVRDLILELKRRGKTVFFSTHILPDVETLCDRVGVILGGRLRDVGRIAELLSPRVRSVEVVLDVPRGGRASGTRRGQAGLARRGPVHPDLPGPGESRTPRWPAVLAAGGALVSLVPHRETLEDFFVRPPARRARPPASRARPGGRVNAAAGLASAGLVDGLVLRRRGAVVGSFLNVVIARVPAGESIVHPRSRCPSLPHAHRLVRQRPGALLAPAPRALPGLPDRASPVRYPLVELLGGGAALVAVSRHGLSLAALAEFAFAATLLALSFIDLDTWLLPHVITVPLLVAGLVLSRAAPHAGARPSSASLAGARGGLALLRRRVLPRREAAEEGGARASATCGCSAGIGAWLGLAPRSCRSCCSPRSRARWSGWRSSCARPGSQPGPAGRGRSPAPDRRRRLGPPPQRRPLRPVPRRGRAGVALAPGLARAARPRAVALPVKP